MKILGIETSCDETAVAIVDVANTATGKHTLISQEIYSQYKEHFDYGGVVPEIASRAHAERLSTLIRKALNKATYTKDNIDGIAVTVGPGLTGGLLMGLMFAKTLSMAWNKPMIGVNHIEGHVLSPLLEEKIEFPYLVLLVSGGHCQFIKVEDIGVYEMLGGTRDDAAGECFDKAARLLNLGHPGGPALEKAAKQGDPLAFKLPKPKVDGLDFSFSGLKTAIAQKIKQQQDITKTDIANMAASIQHTIAVHLADKTEEALKQTGLKTVIVAGGVAANQTIRKALQATADQNDAHFIAPSLSLCTDNAAMIALAGGLRLPHIEHNQYLVTGVRPRWPLEEMEELSK